MAADESRHKKIEHLSEEMVKLYQGMFDRAPVGMGISDAEGNLVAFNDAIMKPGGYTREHIERIHNVANLYYDAHEREVALRLASKQGFLKDFEARFKLKDGTPFLARMSLSPVIFKGQRGAGRP